MKIRIDKADRVFSRFIREKADWKCERCFKQYQPGDQGLHCSHFWGRGKESTRFDQENASALCFFCHLFLGSNPEEHRTWKLKQLGEERYKLLMVRASTYQKKDRKMAAIVCQAMLDDLLLRKAKNAV